METWCIWYPGVSLRSKGQPSHQRYSCKWCSLLHYIEQYLQNISCRPHFWRWPPTPLSRDRTLLPIFPSCPKWFFPPNIYSNLFRYLLIYLSLIQILSNSRTLIRLREDILRLTIYLFIGILFWFSFHIFLLVLMLLVEPIKFYKIVCRFVSSCRVKTKHLKTLSS